MFKFLRKHHTVLLVSMAFCIVGLLLFGIGGGSLAPSPHDAIMKINGTKVTQGDFDRLYNQISRQRALTTPDQQKQAEAETIQELIRMEVFAQEAKKFGIQVPDQDLQLHLANYPAFQKEGQFDTQQYAQTVTQALGIPIAEFEKARRKDIAAQKLTALINASVQIPDALVRNAAQNRIAIETDKAKKKELQENPDIIREELRSREANLVFQDWLGQVNASLRVEPISESLKKRLAGG
jgi:peptidyl-prolyl cis-trans isomerase D